MKNLIYLFLAVAALSACNNKQENTQLVNPEKFSEMIAAEEGQVIDVRTPEEFNAGHIKNAVNINIHDENFESRIESLDKSKAVYVYCKSGGRSADATDVFKEKGFKNIIELDGGITAWKEQGKPVE